MKKRIAMLVVMTALNMFTGEVRGSTSSAIDDLFKNEALVAQVLKLHPDFLCAVNQDIMRNPMTCADGKMYDQTAVEQLIADAGNKSVNSRKPREQWVVVSPMTRDNVPASSFVLNHSIKNVIEQTMLAQHRRNQEVERAEATAKEAAHRLAIERKQAEDEAAEQQLAAKQAETEKYLQAARLRDQGKMFDSDSSVEEVRAQLDNLLPSFQAHIDRFSGKDVVVVVGDNADRTLAMLYAPGTIEVNDAGDMTVRGMNDSFAVRAFSDTTVGIALPGFCHAETSVSAFVNALYMGALTQASSLRVIVASDYAEGENWSKRLTTHLSQIPAGLAVSVVGTNVDKRSAEVLSASVPEALRSLVVGYTRSGSVWFGRDGDTSSKQQVSDTLDAILNLPKASIPADFDLQKVYSESRRASNVTNVLQDICAKRYATQGASIESALNAYPTETLSAIQAAETAVYGASAAGLPHSDLSVFERMTRFLYEVEKERAAQVLTARLHERLGVLSEQRTMRRAHIQRAADLRFAEIRAQNKPRRVEDDSAFIPAYWNIFQTQEKDGSPYTDLLEKELYHDSFESALENYRVSLENAKREDAQRQLVQMREEITNNFANVHQTSWMNFYRASKNDVVEFEAMQRGQLEEMETLADQNLWEQHQSQSRLINMSDALLQARQDLASEQVARVLGGLVSKKVTLNGGAAQYLDMLNNHYLKVLTRNAESSLSENAESSFVQREIRLDAFTYGAPLYMTDACQMVFGFHPQFVGRSGIVQLIEHEVFSQLSDGSVHLLTEEQKKTYDTIKNRMITERGRSWNRTGNFSLMWWTQKEELLGDSIRWHGLQVHRVYLNRGSEGMLGADTKGLSNFDLRKALEESPHVPFWMNTMLCSVTLHKS